MISSVLNTLPHELLSAYRERLRFAEALALSGLLIFPSIELT
jgi:hypothetical protein